MNSSEVYLDLTLTYSIGHLTGGAVCRCKYSVASAVYATENYSGLRHTYTAELSLFQFQTSDHLRYQLGTLCHKVLCWDHYFAYCTLAT